MTSPMMFNIFIEPLLEAIESIGIKILAYADDLVMLTKNELEARVAIKRLEKWAKESFMIINKTKSGIVKIGQKKLLLKDQKGILGYPVVEKYKYLGLDFKTTSNINDHMKRIRKKVFAILFKLKPATRNLNSHQKRLILKVLVAPHLDYIGTIALLIG